MPYFVFSILTLQLKQRLTFSSRFKMQSFYSRRTAIDSSMMPLSILIDWQSSKIYIALEAIPTHITYNLQFIPATNFRRIFYTKPIIHSSGHYQFLIDIDKNIIPWLLLHTWTKFILHQVTDTLRKANKLWAPK